MERRIEHTADGSATLFVPELDESYHSLKGARTESQHVFIEMGLKRSPVPEPQVLEIGFGTGLNAYLTLLAADEADKKIHYTAIEFYPLTWEMVAGLKYSDDHSFRTLHETPWGKEVEITPRFTLTKRKADFTSTDYPAGDISRYDIIYFDAFAPDKQPEMWQEQLFEKLYVIMKEGGVLTTYCAKGVIRRMLQQTGFTVERIPGPPGGKREILRATKT